MGSPRGPGQVAPGWEALKATELQIKRNFSKNYLTPLILTDSSEILRICQVESKFSKKNPKIDYTVLYSIIQYYTVLYSIIP